MVKSITEHSVIYENTAFVILKQIDQLHRSEHSDLIAY